MTSILQNFYVKSQYLSAYLPGIVLDDFYVHLFKVQCKSLKGVTHFYPKRAHLGTS